MAASRPLGFNKRQRRNALLSSASQRQYFERVAKTLPVVYQGQRLTNTFASLYSISSQTITSTAGSSVVAKFGNSAALAVMASFPDFHWLPWLFHRPPREFWVDLSKAFRSPSTSAEAIQAEATVRSYVEWVASQADLHSVHDWQALVFGNSNKIHFNDVRRFEKLGGLLPVLQRLFPSHHWLGPKASIGQERLSRSSTPLSRSRFVKSLWKRLDSGRMGYEEMYSANSLSILRLGGSKVLSEYGSFAKAVMSEVPVHWWQPWRFGRASAGWWSSVQQLIRADDPIGISIGSDLVEQFQANPARKDAVERLGGLAYLQAKLRAPIRLPHLGVNSAVSPEGSDSKSRFDSLQSLVPGGGFEPFYRLTTTDAINAGAMSALEQYNRSFSALVAGENPNHAWKPWSFAATPKSWWRDLGALFVESDAVALAVSREYLRTELGVGHLTDLLGLRFQELTPTQRVQIQHLGGLSFVVRRMNETTPQPTGPVDAVQDPVWQRQVLRRTQESLV